MSEPQSPIPEKFILHKKSRTLEVLFNNGELFIFPCWYLRIYSPSAENKNQLDLKETHKSYHLYKHVNILSIESIGNYAIRPIFSDGHRSGIFSWQTLHELGINQEKNIVNVKKD